MPKQTGPRTDPGKAVTRYNAATHGIYSVTPVVPAFERQADWLDHRARIFTDLDPDGYLQEIIAERIALNSWRLRRLVRYEREQVRNRQRDIPQNLAIHAYLDHRKVRDKLDEDMKLIDRWAMNALIPNEKELMLLMRYEGRLTRHLRLDMLHLEHMKRQRREQQRERRPLLTLAEPEPQAPALRPPVEPQPHDSHTFSPPPKEEGPGVRGLNEPESRPIRGFAERDPNEPALRLS